MAISEWEHRDLCPDGACVGVIGPDGTCKVCGRAAPNWGEERKRGLAEPADADADADDAPAIAGPHGGWGERTLCSDGACIGVIGPDGRCKVCGTPGVRGAVTDDDDDDEYEDDGDVDDSEDDEDEDDEDDELAAAAGALAGVATSSEVAQTDALGAAAADDGDRKLCPDGSCIGVLGPDGRCKVCGKAAT